ncbi:MAG: hypothetical protein LQ349_001100 [Xanthoria aureola]|nr:MAG: hypothetical protein LQ349_001100 [Xanthoria aureola]
MANYNKLTELMGEHQELAMFRRFQKLNVKSLLGMQAEIIHLASELATVEREDERSEDNSRSSLHKSIFNLKASGGSTHCYQWRKVLEVREKLEQYNKALVLYSRVQKLPDPGSRDLHTLQEWLDRPEGGDFFLQGREADTWNDEDDVLTLSRRQADRDSVTRIVNDLIIPWYHCLRSRWDKGARATDINGVWFYHYDTMVTTINAISTLLSALLPSTSIFVLYFLQSPIARLAAAMVFTTIFSSTLFLITKARRIDVFAATTALVFRLSVRRGRD